MTISIITAYPTWIFCQLYQDVQPRYHLLRLCTEYIDSTINCSPNDRNNQALFPILQVNPSLNTDAVLTALNLMMLTRKTPAKQSTAVPDRKNGFQ